MKERPLLSPCYDVDNKETEMLWSSISDISKDNSYLNVFVCLLVVEVVVVDVVVDVVVVTGVVAVVLQLVHSSRFSF